VRGPVDHFNRVLIILVALALVVASVVTFLVSVHWMGAGRIADSGWLHDQLALLEDQDSTSRTVASIASGATVLVALFVIVLEIRPLWHHDRYTLVDTQGAPFALNPESISKAISYEAARIDGVRSVHPELRRTQSGLDVNCDATLDRDAPMPATAELLRSRTVETVEHMTGLPVGDVRLRLRFASERPRRVA